MNEERCKVDLQKDDKYGWKLEVKGDCNQVLQDISTKLGEYGRRYLEDRLVFTQGVKPESKITEPEKMEP